LAIPEAPPTTMAFLPAISMMWVLRVGDQPSVAAPAANSSSIPASS
jgi:hypothetical protein